MSKLNLNLVLSVTTANGPESIGGVFGLPALMFNAPGGPLQPLIQGESVDNPMVVGDELKEVAFRRQLQIMRNSDAHSIDLYQAFQQGKKFLVIAHVIVTDSAGAATSTATLTITTAKMTQFNRKKVGGILANNYRDDMKFSFSSGNTKIEYGSNIDAAVSRAVGKAITAMGSSGK